jgi:hypothetical protein
MVGRAPFGRGDGSEDSDGTTIINAPIVPVNVDLRDHNGNPRFINGHPLVSDADCSSCSRGRRCGGLPPFLRLPAIAVPFSHRRRQLHAD